MTPRDAISFVLDVRVLIAHTRSDAISRYDLPAGKERMSTFDRYGRGRGRGFRIGSMLDIELASLPIVGRSLPPLETFLLRDLDAAKSLHAQMRDGDSRAKV